MTNPDDRSKAHENPSSQAPVEGERREDADQPDTPRVSSQEPAEGSREQADDHADEQ